MLTVLRRVGLAGVMVIVVGLGAPASAATPIGGPIGPNQSFVGHVGGHHDNAVIQVVCAGPIWPGRTGPVVAGQKASVSPSPALSGPGFTGKAGHAVVVGFSDDASRTTVLRAYNTPAPLPSGLRLPCFGTGTVVFTPRPTSPTAHPDVVAVTYQNIAD